MGVPAHDDRDFDFAKLFSLPIRPVIAPQKEDAERDAVVRGECSWTAAGVMLPVQFAVAGELDLAGRSNDEAKERIVGWLAGQGAGKKVTTYKLRDWLFSRQRYWGEPIPIVHWEDGSVSALTEDDLPLVLPELSEYKPGEGGESPLGRATEWLKVVCPKTGKVGRRETNTMPQWAGSCWYYLRFIDPHNNQAPWDPELERKWMPVNLYVGGAEHAVLHLLYSRFWHKVLYDLGYVSTNEPFNKLINQGMMQAPAFKDTRGALVATNEVEEDAQGAAIRKGTGEKLERIIAKMSKSLRNVVNPDAVVEQYGADTLRTYIMFMGPIESSRLWDSKAIMGNYRFLRKAWNFVTDNREDGIRETVESSAEENEIVFALHTAIKKVSEDLELFQFNTSLAALMEFVNQVGGKAVSRETLRSFVLLLAPLAPHLAEELWSRLGESGSVALANWPSYDPARLVVNSIQLVVQVNGKKRAVVEVAAAADEDAAESVVREQLKDTAYSCLDGDRFIFVKAPDTKQLRLVNVIQKR